MQIVVKLAQFLGLRPIGKFFPTQEKGPTKHFCGSFQQKNPTCVTVYM